MNETNVLAKAIKIILRRAIKSGGSTLRDYVRSSGDAGSFQHSFQVYGKQGKPCSRCQKCGTINVIRVIEKETQGGRATFYCPHCQI